MQRYKARREINCFDVMILLLYIAHRIESTLCRIKLMVRCFAILDFIGFLFFRFLNAGLYSFVFMFVLMK